MLIDARLGLLGGGAAWHELTSKTQMSLLYSGRPRGQTSRAMPPAVGMHARGTRALVCTQWRAQLDILPEMIIDQKIITFLRSPLAYEG